MINDFILMFRLYFFKSKIKPIPTFRAAAGVGKVIVSGDQIYKMGDPTFNIAKKAKTDFNLSKKLIITKTITNNDKIYRDIKINLIYKKISGLQNKNRQFIEQCRILN